MQLETPQNLAAPITPAEALTALHTGQWEDSPALRMVVNDAIKAENFQATKQWILQWPQASALYQAPYTARYWPGTQVEAANVPFYTVANCAGSLVPQIMQGLFSDNPPFLIQNRPGTKEQVSFAIGELLGYQLEDINFRQELELGVRNAVVFGTGIWKWGWDTFTKEETHYERKGDRVSVPSPLAGQAPIPIHDDEEEFEEVTDTVYVDRPRFEHIVNLRQLLIDPKLNVPDITRAGYVIHRTYPTWEDLDKLREVPGFTIPSKEDLLMLFFPPVEQAIPAYQEESTKNPLWDARAEARSESTTVDPFNKPLEMLERWDGEKYIVVLQKKLVICNDKNPYGAIPFLSIGWCDVPEAFWSMGLAKMVGSEQRLQVGLTNLMLDRASLDLNGVLCRVRGKSIPTQNIRVAPGKIQEVDAQGDLAPMARYPAMPEVPGYIAMSQARAEQVSGANDMSSGVAGASGHSNMARSSAGANFLAAGASSKAANFVEKLCNQVFLPFLYAAHKMNCSLLPKSTLRYILGEELENKFLKEGGDVLELMNARVKFSIRAGAKMQARRNMAQALPMLVQFLTNEQTTQQLAIAGYRVDVAEIMRMFFEVSDWKNFNDVVVLMTPEEKQQHMQMLAGVQQMQKQAMDLQGKAQLQAQKKQGQSELVDQENIARAGREVLRHVLETAETPEATEGAPGVAGFGDAQQ